MSDPFEHFQELREVVTYSSPGGQKINLCLECVEKFEDSMFWPRAHGGQEFSTISQGLHRGNCSGYFYCNECSQATTCSLDDGEFRCRTCGSANVIPG